MKTFYPLIKELRILSVISILFFSFTLTAKSQTCSESTGTPSWSSPSGYPIANTASSSFTWENTTAAGQFQKNKSTAVTSPILRYNDAGGHADINISYDLAAANPSSTPTNYEIRVIWGTGGTTQVFCTGGSFTVSSTSTRYNFKIAGVNLPGNQTSFQVKLTLTIPSSEKDITTSNFRSDAGIAGSGIVLAVQMNSFSATRSNSNVTINWKTNYEINNRGFEIERRLGNQTNFETVAFVNSNAVNGNSTSPNYYSYTDLNNSTSVSYYRIKQINLDGSSRYSEIRQVDGSKTKAKTLVYPNPAVSGVTNIIFTTADVKNIQVVDMSGQVVKSWSNYSGQELKIVNLKAGVYSVTINNTMTSEKETVRLVVTQ